MSITVQVYKKLPTPIQHFISFNFVTYEKWLLEYIPEKGNVALDIGSNRGFWALHLAKTFNEVYCFEPRVPNDFFKRTRKYKNKIKLINWALWDHSDRLELHICKESSHNFISNNNQNSPDKTRYTLEVRAEPLDRLYIHNKIDFIKIDVEGAESKVLTGALQTIQTNNPIILTEIHSKDQGIRCSVILEHLNYKLQKIQSPYEPTSEEHYFILATPPTAHPVNKLF